MPAKRLGPTAIDKAVGPCVLYDSLVGGLEMRITNKKVWSVRYRINGRQRRYTIGPYPLIRISDARTKATEVLREAKLGRDPQQQKIDDRRAAQAKRYTFESLVDDYLTHKSEPRDVAKDPRPRKLSWKQDKWNLEKHVLPKWRRKLPAEITKSEIRPLLLGIKRSSGPIAANRTFEIIRGVFNHALKWDLVPELVKNPAAHLEAPSEERARDRRLTDDDILVLWYSLKFATPTMAAIHRFQLVTAQRGGEVVALRWCDLELDTTQGTYWTIPAEVAKAGASHVVPLSPLAVEVIESVSRPANSKDTDFVFEGARGKRQRSEALRACELVDIQPHDLRRTAASRMTSLGVGRFVLERVLSHADATVTSRYDLYDYYKEKRQALELWGEHLRRLLMPED